MENLRGRKGGGKESQVPQCQYTKPSLLPISVRKSLHFHSRLGGLLPLSVLPRGNCLPCLGDLPPQSFISPFLLYLASHPSTGSHHFSSVL